MHLRGMERQPRFIIELVRKKKKTTVLLLVIQIKVILYSSAER
jgi:hypothetical protein